MTIIFDNQIPPLHARPDAGALEMDIYCLVPVYGAPESLVCETAGGVDYQLFREGTSISSRNLYDESDIRNAREKMAIRIVERLAETRKWSTYAVGMPKEFIIRSSDGKAVSLPASIYNQLAT